MGKRDFQVVMNLTVYQTGKLSNKYFGTPQITSMQLDLPIIEYGFHRNGLADSKVIFYHGNST